MLFEGSLATGNIFALTSFWLVLKIGILALGAVYLIFSLIVVRQVSLMVETVSTELAPFIRALSVVNAGLTAGVIILLVGLFFG